MTKFSDYDLQVEMLDFSSTYKRGLYKGFKVNDAASSYSLEYASFEGDETAFVRDGLEWLRDGGHPFQFKEDQGVCTLERANVSGWMGYYRRATLLVIDPFLMLIYRI